MSFLKFVNLSKNVKALCNIVANKALQSLPQHQQLYRALQIQPHQNVSLSVLGGLNARHFHTSPMRTDLMEFFDDPKNWKENEVKCGRAWKLDELRIKSNKELHQLWYILLKERNMLMTMEHECDDKMELFPSPERLDKVKISMKNLERVVQERNKAYHLLETGETGERPKRLVANPLGIRYMYRSCEHVLPPYINVKWLKNRPIGYGGRAVRKFLLQYREKLWNVKRKAKNRNRNEVMMLLRRNPNISVDLLRSKYPDVNVAKLIRDDKTRGHYIPKVEA